MSAITGILHFHNHISAVDLGEKLLHPLKNIPFDSTDTYNRNNLFLGCIAQWIMPEDINKKQCFYDSEKRLAITADVTLDNRPELFNKLDIPHERQKQITDSELILLAYTKWQEDTAKHLIGDFAFIIWDERNHKLFGARDFSGSRTLYYHHNPDQFVFSTTFQPLLQMPFISNQINDYWMAEYLSISNMIDTHNAIQTVYRDIQALPPAHTITISSGKTVLRRYHKFQQPEIMTHKSRSDVIEEFQELYKTAVTSRLRTHKKVGSQLSGGLDSGSIVSIASPYLKQHNKQLHSYSAIPIPGYEDWTPSYMEPDERKSIKLTVNHVGNITDQYFHFQDRTPLNEIDPWLDLMEMPYKFFENAAWMRGIHETASQQGIGLLLNGARGNFSISWGPGQYYFAELLKKKKLITLLTEMRKYSHYIDAKPSRVFKAVKQLAYPKHSSRQENAICLLSPDLEKRTNITQLLLEEGTKALNASPNSIYELRKNHFAQLNIWNATGTSRTKLSLKYNVQTHDPTNDLRIINFCLSVPLPYFFGDGLDRGLIRRASKGFLPDRIRLNMLKRGLQGADILQRMKSSWSVLYGEVHDLIQDPLASAYLNVTVIKQALEKLQRAETPPKQAFDSDFLIVMRSLIVYRFLKSLKGGEMDEKRMANTGIRST
ncbi:asparagine synthase-related protein [Fictibacillus nanhaiensis]|uniref:asparagine synthase-related protein n=1 Tax=Fictibacillus nanhaiensis TaxID=742169 RepID=UPI002E211DAC|nr:asparagine synthase-related protein [Fictibacillus nanhaiensis]MED1863895.1 asparagine synthase-related protein [Fictibacillus nanhaiensis]